jgi:hypothetical protein
MLIIKDFDPKAHANIPSNAMFNSQLLRSEVQSVCSSLEPQVGLIIQLYDNKKADRRTDRKLVTDRRAIIDRNENSRIDYSKNVIVNSKKMIFSSADKNFRRPNKNAGKDPRHCRYQRVLPPHFSIKKYKPVDDERPKIDVGEEIKRAYVRVGSNGSGGSNESGRKQLMKIANDPSIMNQQIDCKAAMHSLELVPYDGGQNQRSMSNSTSNILRHCKSKESTNVNSLTRMGSSGSKGSSMKSVSRSNAAAENLARIRSQPRACSPQQDKTIISAGLVNKKVKRLVCNGENHIQSFMLALQKIESKPVVNVKKTRVTWANEQWSKYVMDK